jgi:hypothetical protein
MNTFEKKSWKPSCVRHNGDNVKHNEYQLNMQWTIGYKTQWTV